MKSLMIAAALLSAGTAVALTPPPRLNLQVDGALAEAIAESLRYRTVDMQVSGEGSLSCVQHVPSIPDGAQGIFFPVATCTAYPIVNFPDGALGIVAPWFSLNGLLGQELYSLLPMAPDADGAKTFTGQMTIKCEESFATTCIIRGY